MNLNRQQLSASRNKRVKNKKFSALFRNLKLQVTHDRQHFGSSKILKLQLTRDVSGLLLHFLKIQLGVQKAAPP